MAADDAVLGAPGRADVADHDLPGVEADAHLDLGQSFASQHLVHPGHGTL